jgi:RecA-family ATPase
LVLGWLLAVATGGKALGCKQVEQGDVLYLALEDSERRLKERIKKVLKGRTPDLSGFEYATQWEKADEGGAERLDAWLTDHPHTRLVVIDVLKMWRAKTNTRDGIYNVDYESVAELIALSKKHNVSIVIVHHNNKQVKPEDPFDNISGSTGLLGAVDAIIVMQRERGKDVASYWITGKDIEATSRHAMVWKPETLSWVLEGDAEKYFESEERLEIEELLEAEKGLWGPKEIAEALGKKPATIRWLMTKMIKGENARVVRPSRGKYCHTTSPHNKESELGSEGADQFSLELEDDSWDE